MIWMFGTACPNLFRAWSRTNCPTCGPHSAASSCDYGRKKLRDSGVVPYPMPYKRPAHQRGCRCPKCEARRELVDFQRWVVFAYDKWLPWAEWEAASYRPEKLHITERRMPLS